MIRTLTGENLFNLEIELDRFVQAFLREHNDLALERYDGETAEFDRLYEALTSLPFLASKKLVVISRGSANKRFTEQIDNLLNNISDATDVILVEVKLDKRASYYKYLKKNTEFKEFRQLDLPELSRWLVAEAAARGGSLSSPDARYLIERLGPMQQVIGNELEKLLLYDKNISRHSIDQLTEPSPQSTIFQLLEAAFEGDSRHALKIYDEQRTQAVEPPQIIAMLAWQLQILALVKAAGDRTSEAIATDARLSPFVVRKSQTIARRLTIRQLKKLVDDLLAIDLRSKRESIDVDDVLKLFLLKLAI